MQDPGSQAAFFFILHPAPAPTPCPGHNHVCFKEFYCWSHWKPGSSLFCPHFQVSSLGLLQVPRLHFIFLFNLLSDLGTHHPLKWSSCDQSQWIWRGKIAVNNLEGYYPKMAYGNKVMSVRVNKKGSILVLGVGEVTCGVVLPPPDIRNSKGGWWGEVEKTVLELALYRRIIQRWVRTLPSQVSDAFIPRLEWTGVLGPLRSSEK